MAILGLGMMIAPFALAAETGPEHPDADHDGDDSGAPVATSQAVVSTPAGRASAVVTTPVGSSSSSSSGVSSSFMQTISIPEENVLAVLALRGSGIGLGWGGIDSIANIQRTSSVSAFANRNVALDSNDVLLSLALGNRGFVTTPFLGSSFGTGGLGFGASPFFGSTFGSSSIRQCLIDQELFGHSWSTFGC